MRNVTLVQTPKYVDAMLKYLVILLDDTSVSFCHYGNLRQKRNMINLETLRKGMKYGMLENLAIQFVYPDYDLPNEYAELVNTIDHSEIKPVTDDGDVLIVSEWEKLPQKAKVPVVLRTNKVDFFAKYKEIYPLLENAPRVNIVFTDVETFTEVDFESYKYILTIIGKELERLYVKNEAPQLNLLTDRLLLTQMNNCGAGDSTITLAPNGKFYVCPAFYYEDDSDNIGDVNHGLEIKNKQLYKLETAPICRHCDAYQCRRCVWLNKKLTFEVNTPSREQCILAHFERNASRELLYNIRKHGDFMPDTEICEIDYLDPFEKRETWNLEN